MAHRFPLLMLLFCGTPSYTLLDIMLSRWVVEIRTAFGWCSVQAYFSRISGIIQARPNETVTFARFGSISKQVPAIPHEVPEYNRITVERRNERVQSPRGRARANCNLLRKNNKDGIE